MATTSDHTMQYTIEDHTIREKDLYALSKYKITARWLKAHFGSSISQNLTLFNIGCGSGEFNRRAALMNFRVIGFEPDSTTFKIAQERNVANPNIRLQQYGILDIDPNNQRADAIVMHDVLEHIKNDRRAAAHLSQILKPNGTIVLSVPALPFLFGLHDEQLFHFRRYTKNSLRALLEPYFSIKKIRYFGLSFIPIVYWYSVLKRQPYPHTEARTGLAAIILKLICFVESSLYDSLIGTSILVELGKKGNNAHD